MEAQDLHAARFRQTREDHRVELAEDYVEAILDLIDEQGEARTTDIATRMGVAHPTVAKAMKRLEKEGLVVLSPYRPTTLTAAGLALARECRRRHRVVVDFLIALGLKGEQAEAEAEGIEHHVSKATLGLMEQFVATRS
jgi:DtxR family manganese transport transcriptional regulator